MRADPFDPLNEAALGAAGLAALAGLCACRCSGSRLVVAGLFTPGPTLAGYEKSGLAQAEPARGVLRITRHPFLWGVALWALGHLLVNGERFAVMLFGALGADGGVRLALDRPQGRGARSGGVGAVRGRDLERAVRGDRAGPQQADAGRDRLARAGGHCHCCGASRCSTSSCSARRRSQPRLKRAQRENEAMLVLDRAHFDHMTGADRALQLEVLGLFRMQVEGWTRRVRRQRAGWRDAVHTLKGSARGIGLNGAGGRLRSRRNGSGRRATRRYAERARGARRSAGALEQFAAEAA